MKKGNKKATAAIGLFDDAKWQAEEDMRTLIRADEIKADKKRFAAAKAMAKTKLEEKRQEAANMAKLAAK